MRILVRMDYHDVGSSVSATVLAVVPWGAGTATIQRNGWVVIHVHLIAGGVNEKYANGVENDGCERSMDDSCQFTHVAHGRRSAKNFGAVFFLPPSVTSY